MRRVALLQAMRLNSERLPGKLLQKVGTQTLLAKGLEKMVALRSLYGVTPIAAVCPEDAPLVEAARAVGVELLERDERSRSGRTYAEVFGGWAGLLRDRFDWVLDLNIICRPFLSLETLGRVCDAVRECHNPFVTVLEERGVVWDEAGAVVIGEGEMAETKTKPRYYVLAHVGYGLPVEMLGDAVAITARLEKLVLRLRPEERIDIDTQADLEYARMLAH